MIQNMIGTIVNTGAIIVGSTLGALLKKGAVDRFKEPLTKAIGLVAVALGINMIAKNMSMSSEPLLLIISMAVGAVIGTGLRLSDRVDALGEKTSKVENRLIEGLTTAVLLFCIGALSILGPIEGALKGDYTLLFTNASLDLVTSFILSSTFGIGIMIAAPILFCWQGAIYLLAKLSGSGIEPQLLIELSIIGGILIMATGLNILKVTKLKTLDYLPALLVPVVYFLF